MSEPRLFGHLPDGRAIHEYTLCNHAGASAKILDYGGVIRVLEIPDKFGRNADVVLGFDELKPYVENGPYFGAIIGRVAGRIGAGRVLINDESHLLSINEPPNHIHGGHSGFTHKVWDADFRADTRCLSLSYSSPAGEEGYPGNLFSRVTYTLNDQNELIIGYFAHTDAPTPVNLTQHSYFNLSGEAGGGLRDHQIKINADVVMETDDHLLPTGRVLDVSATELDRRSFGPVNDFDDYWILSGSGELQVAAELRHDESGRLLQVLTTAPGLQIYSGTALPAQLPGKNGALYGVSDGICFETQIHPDSTNHSNFPSTVLEPGDVFESTTVFRFSVLEKGQENADTT